jgi:hypothetical protein
LTVGQEFAKKNDFSPSRDFRNSFEFSKLETHISGTLFAFIKILLGHRMKETSEELANTNGVKFMCKRFILGGIIWLILVAVVAFLQSV